jgi:hypothetical protein
MSENARASRRFHAIASRFSPVDETRRRRFATRPIVMLST